MHLSHPSASCDSVEKILVFEASEVCQSVPIRFWLEPEAWALEPEQTQTVLPWLCWPGLHWIDSPHECLWSAGLAHVSCFRLQCLSCRYSMLLLLNWSFPSGKSVYSSKSFKCAGPFRPVEADVSVYISCRPACNEQPLFVSSIVKFHNAPKFSMITQSLKNTCDVNHGVYYLVDLGEANPFRGGDDAVLLWTTVVCWWNTYWLREPRPSFPLN